jgi:hypothetical protein
LPAAASVSAARAVLLIGPSDRHPHMATKHNSVSLIKADDTEPIFVLRAQDRLAAAVVRFWADEAQKAGANAAKIAEAREVADAMEQWPSRKVPD